MIYAQLEDGTLLPANAAVFPEWSISEGFGFGAGGVSSSVTHWGGSRGRAVHSNILKVCIRCRLHEINFEYFVRRCDGPLAGRWSTDATSGVSRSAKNLKSTVQWQIQEPKRPLFLFPYGVLYLYITYLKNPSLYFPYTQSIRSWQSENICNSLCTYQIILTEPSAALSRNFVAS